MNKITKILILFLFILLTNFVNADAVSQEREVLFRPVIANKELRQILLSSGKQISSDFDYSALLDDDTDVLLVGEEHHNNVAARDVNLMIKNLTQAQTGLGYVASEFLLSSEQPIIDDYYKRKITYPELKKKCKLKDRAFVAEIARRYNVKTIGLDMPKAHEDYVWAMSAEGIGERNNAWVDILLDIKENDPDALIVVHAGGSHTATFSQYYPTVPQLLKKEGLKTKTLEFVYAKDKLWQQLGINSRYDILFKIPKELKKYIQADYIIWNTDADYSQEDKTELSRISNQNSKKFSTDEVYSDGCLLDPDNPFCKVVIRGSRVKK